MLGGDKVAVIDAHNAGIQLGHERPFDLVEVGDASDGDNALSHQSPKEEARGFCAIEGLVGNMVWTDGQMCQCMACQYNEEGWNNGDFW